MPQQATKSRKKGSTTWGYLKKDIEKIYIYNYIYIYMAVCQNLVPL